MQESRVSNASRNILFGMFLKGYQILMPFLMRTAMMYYMGMEYLGLNSLFGSILWALNLAELGVGSAMVYSMYQPIIDGDKEEICALLKLYKKYYRVIGTVIAVVGLAITPFIPKLIKQGTPEDINIYVVYLLNLFCTVMTYWLFAYKNSLLVAHQRNDIASKVMLVTNTFMYGTQFLIVIFLKDYYWYLIAAIVTQAFTNVITAYYANKLYPDYQPVGSLGKMETMTINGRIKDLFTAKLGNVIVSSCDSIVISAFLGLVVLGVYQNYYYILTAVMGIVKVVFDSCTAGIGNSILVDSMEKNYKDLKKLTFITTWLTGFCSACLLVLFQPFMKLWAGEESMLAFSAVICFVIYFFVDQMNQLLLTYKDAAGIWHEDRFRPLITALTNLVLNLIFVQFWGIYGVIWATVVSKVCVGMPWLFYNLSTVLFKRSMKGYILRMIGYGVVIAVVCAVTYFACTIVTLGGIPGLILKALLCTLVSNLLFLLMFFKSAEFRDTIQIVKRVIKR
ncbi:MAG: polysaccharide biosynthesis protein [Lachnospiraceae bacterium]|nr:polysaccharide biosynthesis protein [Lachnospiraceae bacterium]